MKYWYGMPLRPDVSGCLPKGFIELIEDEGRRGIVEVSKQF